MQVPAEGGKPTRLLPPEAGVVSVAYSPDGRRIAVWTKNGLEVLTPANGERSLVFKWNPTSDGYIFRSWGIGGLAWSRKTGQIAFALSKGKTGESELWLVNEAGTDSRRIYSAKEGRIVVSDFLD
jgi:dipeptidyl aminopeptidase/acylaminoacyl peptidase